MSSQYLNRSVSAIGLILFCAFLTLSPISAEAWLGSVVRGMAKNSPRHLDADILTSINKTRTVLHPRLGHNYICPSQSLKVSLPALNVAIRSERAVNIRVAPAENAVVKTYLKAKTTYIADIVSSNDCWIEISYKTEGHGSDAGWIYAQYVAFEFQNHLTKPQASLTQTLTPEGVYELVSPSIYKLLSANKQGSGVAISTTVLLTNCHVLDGSGPVSVVDAQNEYVGTVIRHDFFRDKCFIRVQEMALRPIPNVRNFESIKPGITSYTIGTPLGYERTIGDGIVSGLRLLGDVRYVQITSPISPGSSGGGVFDGKGNLLGITTFTDSRGQNLNFAIAAEDFWR